MTARAPRHSAKRAFDLLCASIGLVVLAPVFVVAAITIKATSPGPVFFMQTRVGRGFRPFQIYKFRTMVAAQGGAAITYGADPRITKAGALLRRLKIDELPQLINIVKGEMSLVGPRPEIPRYVKLFEQDYREILAVRPGITDLASLKYRDEATILGLSASPEDTYVQSILPDKVQLAKEYVRTSSLRLDVALILKTLFHISRRRPAV